MDIRLIFKKDLTAINRIYNQAVHQKFCTAHLSPLDMNQREAWFKLHIPDRFPVYVATHNELVTGWVSLGSYRTGRQALAHVAEVSYYVDAKERGRGIGSMLLEHARAIAPSFDFNVLIILKFMRSRFKHDFTFAYNIDIIGNRHCHREILLNQ